MGRTVSLRSRSANDEPLTAILALSQSCRIVMSGSPSDERDLRDAVWLITHLPMPLARGSALTPSLGCEGSNTVQVLAGSHGLKTTEPAYVPPTATRASTFSLPSTPLEKIKRPSIRPPGCTRPM